MPTTHERPRRLRSREAIRALVRETVLNPANLAMPIFVTHGRGKKHPIRSMPGIFQFSSDTVIKEAHEIYKLGIGTVILFGIPEKKDLTASGAYAKGGIVQQAVRAIRDKVPDLAVITDVCLCEYMSHGHCGVIRNPSLKIRGGRGSYEIDNDATLDLLARTAVSHAEAGADIVAPSAMMDGQVAAIRKGLDGEGFKETPILSYAVKYASSFYGPFREAAESPPKFGDRKSYQMDPANWREGIKEARLDIREGADIIMVKPALSYLDLLARLRDATDVPLAAYNVSGEYAMVKAAAQKGWIDEEQVILEQLTSIKRAGADIIITYFAKQIARTLAKKLA